MSFISDYIAIVTSTTCGEACWSAREDICRCSCGGKNHGCLRDKDGIRPQRIAKIDGVRYKLAGVSSNGELYEQAREVNRLAGYKSVESAHLVEGICGKPNWYSQYKYTWSTTDPGAPARLKIATKAQVEKWPELSAWRGQTERERYFNPVQLLWIREVMPDRPKTLVVDKHTGMPLADQNPEHCY